MWICLNMHIPPTAGWLCANTYIYIIIYIYKNTSVYIYIHTYRSGMVIYRHIHIHMLYTLLQHDYAIVHSDYFLIVVWMMRIQRATTLIWREQPKTSSLTSRHLTRTSKRCRPTRADASVGRYSHWRNKDELRNSPQSFSSHILMLRFALLPALCSEGRSYYGGAPKSSIYGWDFPWTIQLLGSFPWLWKPPHLCISRNFCRPQPGGVLGKNLSPHLGSYWVYPVGSKIMDAAWPEDLPSGKLSNSLLWNITIFNR